MKKILVYLALSLMTSVALADIILDNKTKYPEKTKQSKIAIQWSESSEAIQKANRHIINGSILDVNSLKVLRLKGPIKLSPPTKAQYFRVVVWSNGKKSPDLLTNWVDVVPNKTYVITQDLLVPAVLLSGTGC